MLIEIHQIKNYPTTCLNRDDTGAPKTCNFGGVLRGRISSQCLKRTWRTYPLFQKQLGTALGTRTRNMPRLVCDELAKEGQYGEYLDVVKDKLTAIANKGSTSDTGMTSQIVFYSPADIQALTGAVKSVINKCATASAFKGITIKELTKHMTDAKTRPISLDMALWGRMVTADAFADVEASMQVAHAFSTHKIQRETDFFTAMDDMLTGDSDGAAMVGTADYNSSCYYEYAAIDIDKLRENLKYSGDADHIIRKTLPTLLQTIAFANPAGKQHSFAGNELPSLLNIEVKPDNIPETYANAFVQPAGRDRNKDIITDSAEKLAKQIKQTADAFCIPAQRFWFYVGAPISKIERILPDTTGIYSEFTELIEDIVQAVLPAAE